MSKDHTQNLLASRLRFPEFRDTQSWVQKPLGALAEPITERVGTSGCIPYTVTSGEGLIRQEEKYGRTIAGNSLRNYYRLQRDDFAFNKSATKLYPQGYIARFQGDEHAAVPNSIFTCFRITDEDVDPAYLDYLFRGNLHGRWLTNYVAVGARAHGALNIGDDDLFSLPVPLPAGEKSLNEQKKIATCLGSVDGLIVAEARKLEALRTHKKGLMQQLFPRQGETRPRLRFPEFQNEREWNTVPLGEFFETKTGGTPNRTNREYWGGTIPWITTSLVDFNVIQEAPESITEAGLQSSSAKLFPKGTVLVALYGQGKTRGKVAMLDIEASTNQACAAILPVVGFDPQFTFLSLSGRYEELRSLSNSGSQRNLNQGLIRDLPFCYPCDPAERQRIVDCLTSLNALIASQMEKVDALRTHSRGLIQQLFPSPENQ